MSTVLRKLGVEIDLSGDGNEELRAWIKNLHEARGQGISMAGGLSQLEREMVEAAQKIGLSREQLKGLADQAKRNREISDFAQRYGFSMSEVERASQRATGSVGTLKTALQALAAAGVGAKMFGMGREMVGLASSYETATVRFKVMLGSAEQAQQVMSDINRFSNETPYEPDEVMAAAQQLLNARVPLTEMQDHLRMVGDVAAATGIRFDELATIFGRQKTSGIVQMEDINQFAGRGIPIFDELARVMNVTTDRVREMSSKGAIRFEHLQQAFRNMTSEGGRYQGMMAELAQTSEGQWSTLSGNINTVKRSFGIMLLSGLKPVLELMVQGSQWILDHAWAMNVLKGVVIVLSVIIGIVLVGAMYSAAAAAWSMVTGMLSAFTILIAEFVLATMSAWSFAAGMIVAAAPVLLIVAAIGLVVGAVVLLYDWISGGDSILGGWFGSFGEVVAKIKGLFIGLWNGIKSVVSGILNFFRANGRYIIMALFPVSILYFYWDQISGFLRSIPGRIMDFFRSIPDRILSALSGLKDRMKSYISELLPAWAVRLVARVTGGGEQREAVEARASGGPVRVGREYLVGERGPERFIPDTGGTIIPNGGGDQSPSAGRGITFAPVITITGASENDGRSIAESVERALRDMMPSFLASLGLEVS